MNLPKITTPLIPITLPSTGEELTVRQFLTKEYKTIMSAYNAKNVSVFFKTVSKIIEDCVVEPEDFSVEKYSSFDIDYIFLQLYTLSVSGIIDVTVTCQSPVEKKVKTVDELGFEHESEETELQPCGAEYNMKINSHDVTITEIKDGVFDIADNVTVKMKYPTWKVWGEITSQMVQGGEAPEPKTIEEMTPKEREKAQKDMDTLLYKCLDEIWVGDDKWEEEFTKEEFIDWVDTFPTHKLAEVMQFIQNIPQLQYKRTVLCPTCGKQSEINMMGLQSFLK